MINEAVESKITQLRPSQNSLEDVDALIEKAVNEKKNCVQYKAH